MSLQRISKSLITRLILFGVLLVVSGGLARYLLLAQFLREDLVQVVSAQQTALAAAVADDIEHKLVDRLKMLDRLKDTFPLDLLEHPENLKAWLAERHQIHPVFSLGLLVADTHGKVISDFPPISGRKGSSIVEHPGFSAVLAGKSGIGKPQLGTFSRQPILPMGVPLRSADGTIRAVLIGISALDSPDFLERIFHGRIGQTGGFLLVSPADKLFVAADDPDLVLKPTPAAGINPLHDRALQGFRGNGVTVNAKGVEELVAIADVPSTGWFVVARMSTAEAFEPVKRVQSRIIQYGVLAVIAVCIVIGIVFRLLLRPLFHAADLAERMTQGEIPLAPIPIVRDDEVGHLTKAFNRLLEKLSISQAELEHMAHYDALTRLPNRRLLADRMQQALARAKRNGSRVALLFLDLDGFKPINDEFGHEFGDAALIEVTRRLTEVVRESDTLARVGGDEFVYMFADLADDAEDDVANIASKCIAVLSKPIELKNSSCSLGVSIGIAIGNGSCDPEQLLIAADMAMYDAKKKGRGCYAIATNEAVQKGTFPPSLQRSVI
ncbi:MAG TPA: GGDEF domain-containing protein [Azonexus sp.]|nr:GGDEF domain-containing protein [Azonexus sp.]